jgi:cytochrome c
LKRLLFPLALALVPASLLAASSPPSLPDARYFDTKVAPILTRRCLGCHNNDLKNGNISFQDRGSLLQGGSRGPSVVPGDPAQSILITALRHEGELQMPPGPALPAKEILILTEWVRRGAVWGTKLQRTP